MTDTAKTFLYIFISIAILGVIIKDKPDTYQLRSFSLLILMLILKQLVEIRHKNK